MVLLTKNEERALESLRRVDRLLRIYLNDNITSENDTVDEHLIYMNELGKTLGNLKNHTSAMACILAKHYLQRHYDVVPYDACEKQQGAKGLDVECWLRDGARVIGEVKTTTPYAGQKLGAAQLTSFKKDLQRLSDEAAVQKYFFVIDKYAGEEAMSLIARHKYDLTIQVVNLLSEKIAF